MKKTLTTTLIFAAFLGGCSNAAPPPVGPEHPDLAHDGVAPHVWAEPMVDVIDVPPGLDPEGHYYRPAHKDVVEIRQGKWQYYKDTDSDNKDGDK